MPRLNSVFFGNSPRQYAPKTPRRLGFKSSPTGFDNGRFPSCAINGSNRFIEVHMGEDNDTLNFRQGRLEKLDFRLTDSRGRPKLGDGRHPAVAFNDSNVAIVLADQNNQVKYAVATVDINADANPPFKFTTFTQTGSTDPSVALSAAGVVVEVHQSGNGLAWRRGKLAGTTLTWSPVKSLIANGARPSVAINNNGAVVVLFEQGGKLVYLTGTFDKSKTAITDPIQFAATAKAFVSSGNRRRLH